MTGFRGVDSDRTFFIAFLGIFLKLWEHLFEDFCSQKLEHPFEDFCSRKLEQPCQSIFMQIACLYT
jgi:hypothetical protein